MGVGNDTPREISECKRKYQNCDISQLIAYLGYKDLASEICSYLGIHSDPHNRLYVENELSRAVS